MNIFLINYFVFTALLSFSNIYIVCKLFTDKNLSNAGVIYGKFSSDNDADLTYKEILFFLGAFVDIFYLVLSTLIFLFTSEINPLIVIFWTVLVIGLNTSVINYAATKLSESISVQLFFLPKKNKIPLAVSELKLDVYHIFYTKPYYLRHYEYPEQDTASASKFDAIRKDYSEFNEKVCKEDSFPLFMGMSILSKMFVHKPVQHDNALVSAYLLDNISFLTTIMTILKDERLVKSLSSSEGLNELIELTTELHEVILGLDDILFKVMEEKKTFKKASESVEILDGLNEVRSLREFGKSLK